ncbi:hypothetical protein E1163_21245, partial [Fulvivirga kasyanovii]|nr:hypothetical protein [Fulvivirga kasyanovii]
MYSKILLLFFTATVNINLIALLAHYKLCLALLFLFLVNHRGQSQFADDFSDGNITANPVWVSSNLSGNGADFQVSSGVLQSNGPAATSTLWISNNHVPDVSQLQVVWEFKARYDAAPSSSNNVEVYLFSNSSDLTATTEGYFIRLGESGSNDGIELFKTGSSTPLIADPSASVAAGFDVSIKVTRDTSGKWILEADISGGSTYEVIGTAIDKEFVNGDYFGFKVEHTSTRNKAFFFDDVAITSSDQKAPGLVALEVVSDSQLDLIFSENLDKQTAEDVNNYVVDHSVDQPTSASLDDIAPNVVHLSFEQTFSVGSTYQINIVGIEDLAGNTTSSILAGFVYFVEEPAVSKDVIITEIMADPSPANDLPEKEFVEIYNNSDKVFDLANWQFSDLKDAGILSHHYLFPGDYVILCSKDAINEFQQLGAVIGLDIWPTLNNSEDFLQLRDVNGVVLDSVHYSNSWYKSSFKSEGGWSLELIDPANLCSSIDNWVASEQLSGGTPGAANSVLSQNPDLTPPQITEVLGLRPDSVIVRFNEVLDTDIVPGNFTLSPEIGVSGIALQDNLTEVGLKLSGQLQGNTPYQLKVNSIRDCSGNLINNETTYDFYLVEPADSLEVIINEVLFNPYSGGVDFVELYNNSPKYINLKGWAMANAEVNGGKYDKKQISSIAMRDIVMKPHSYLAVTEDGGILKGQYPNSKEEAFIEVSKLPAYNDDAGVVILLNQDSALMDLFEYSEAYHFALLADKEGVSLERVSFSAPTDDADNWKSASSTVAFATPGYINSQTRQHTQAVNGQIVADPKVIVPDGSGRNDFTVINYAFDQAGYVANTRI